MTQTDYMCQEKKKEEDLPALKTALMHWYNDSMTIKKSMEGACGVMVIIIGNGHGDTSSNPGRDWWHFT